MKNRPCDSENTNDPMNSAEFFRLKKLPHFLPRMKKAVFGAARMATVDDLNDYLNRPDEANPSRLADATILAESRCGRKYDPQYKKTFFIPDETRTRNILAIGQTGAGKTSELIDPLIYSDIRCADRSLVIIDAKGDSHHKHLPFLKMYRPNQPVQVIDFADAARTTHGWNFLAGYDDEQDDLNRAESMCYAVDGDAPRHWDNQYWFGGASRFIAATISCLRREHGTVSPGSVHRMLEKGHSENVDLWKRHPDVTFAAEALAFLRSGSHNAETVLSTAQMYLRSMRHRSLAAVTSADEFRFMNLFRRPGVVFVEIPQGEIDKIRPWVNIFLSELFREAAAFAASTPGNRLEVPLRIHADDLVAAAGRVQGLGSHLNLSRSRNIGITAAVQSMAQIQETYGDQSGSVLAGFASKMFRAPVDPFDADWVSRQSGTTTVEVVERMSSQDEEGRVTRTRIGRYVARPLLLPEDVRYSPEHFAYGKAWTALLHDARPMQLWLRASFDLPAMAGAMLQAARTAREPVLRSKPLTFETGRVAARRKRAGQVAKDNFVSQSPLLIKTRISDLSEQIACAKASDDARQWWGLFVESNSSEGVIRLMEELVARKATLAEFHDCSLQCPSDEILDYLDYMTYRRLKRKFEQEPEFEIDYEGEIDDDDHDMDDRDSDPHGHDGRPSHGDRDTPPACENDFDQSGPEDDDNIPF